MIEKVKQLLLECYSIHYSLASSVLVFIVLNAVFYMEFPPIRIILTIVMFGTGFFCHPLVKVPFTCALMVYSLSYAKATIIKPNCTSWGILLIVLFYCAYFVTLGLAIVHLLFHLNNIDEGI